MSVRMIGVTNTVRMADVAQMGGNAAQDRFITEAAKFLERELREFVGSARPAGDFVFQVTGPHNDPLQGLVYLHTLAAPFDVNRLPTECRAWRAYTDGDGNGAVTHMVTGNPSADA